MAASGLRPILNILGGRDTQSTQQWFL
ncbi:hypothetical protein UFOVP1562_57, partial [uncultured Caudovirales phage]